MTDAAIDAEEFFTDAACWSGGLGSEWEGDALLSGEFYGDLVQLIYDHVPADKLQAFMFQWNASK